MTTGADNRTPQTSAQTGAKKSAQLRMLQITWGLWALFYVMSFVAFALTPPTGDSFVRGLNRLVPLFWLQVAALVAALYGLYHARGLRPSFPRWWWLARIPIAVAILQAALIAGVIINAQARKPPPPESPPPTTKPAPAPDPSSP